MSTHRRTVAAVVAALLSLCPAGLTAYGQAATRPADAGLAPLAEPAELTALDRPNDAGQVLLLTWKRMPFEAPDVYYEILMSDEANGPFVPQGKRASLGGCPLKSDFPASFGYARSNRDYHAVELFNYTRRDAAGTVIKDLLAKHRGKAYFFRLNVLRGDQTVVGKQQVSATPRSNWVAWQKANVFAAMIFLAGAILYAVRRAKRHPSSIFIRRIAGLEAVDEALGRAAEMGKPVFFCHGLGGVSAVVTISAMNILGKIAERVAEFGTEMKVTCCDYLVMQVSQEMAKEAYVRVGRPDAYKSENIFYISEDPFTYATAVAGMLMRERPATCFYFGQFQAESLLLCETGAMTKAIQIAGTDAFNQIPFFIATCDYTLIGEEVYAASAYLSREPKLLGTVNGQDIVKAVLMVVLTVGTVLASLMYLWFARLFWPLN